MKHTLGSFWLWLDYITLCLMLIKPCNVFFKSLSQRSKHPLSYRCPGLHDMFMSEAPFQPANNVIVAITCLPKCVLACLKSPTNGNSLYLVRVFMQISCFLFLSCTNQMKSLLGNFTSKHFMMSADSQCLEISWLWVWSWHHYHPKATVSGKRDLAINSLKLS